ncbi:MAG TPA: type IV toxin-antitoxin system AbiEi family antitoxin domain-containing protein [Oryzihumus sp.]|nr:type IV toxin-antitoxin system AbiEi family antitoxin domain-containing protein [Oryzihumus sp.]
MNDLLRFRLAAQDGAVTSGEALECGYHWRDLGRLVARGELVRVRTGAYVDAAMHASASAEQRHALRSFAVCRSFGGRLAISHDGAVALAGLPLTRTAERIHLTRMTQGPTRTVAGVVTHPAIDAALVGVVRTLPCVRLPAALLQVAALHGLEAGVVAADAAVHRRLTKVSDLRFALPGIRLGPGRGSATAMLELVDGRSESVGESRTRLVLHALGLPVPEPQAEIRDARGVLVGRVDLFFRQQRTVVEFDGLLKYREEGQRALVREKVREDRLRALGLEVVRLTWRDLDDPGLVLDLVRAAFARAARTSSAGHHPHRSA